MPISEPIRSRMLEKLRRLYDQEAAGILARIDQLADRYAPRRETQRSAVWDESSIVLITYPDQVRTEGLSALAAQKQFLLEYGLDKVISAVHLLPFFPYSSDDGFSVIDYRFVNPDFGDWSDVDSLGESFGLMFDFVVNHCSQRNDWFQSYLRRESPHTKYFIDVDPQADLSAVIRPRSTPVRTAYETSSGTKHVWTTFSADQVDLNFACPDVLVEMLDVLLLYVQHGATVIRLDAIGFLWKKIGTTCMHLPETHTVVKLMRDLVDELAPGTILLTETNVPHEENISYFGEADEAHAVYQFSLAPLLLDAFLTADATPLNDWLHRLEYPARGMTYFNFTASHDGIGVRPLEGLVTRDRLTALVHSVRQRGGLVSTRRMPDGTERPYELNITFFSAMGSPDGLDSDAHVRKFLTSQGIMLALRGVPGIYFQSLVGTPNYSEGVRQTGHKRTINRRKFDSDWLRKLLADEASAQRKVLDGYRKMLAVRIQQPAFHPDAEQTVVQTENKALVGFMRTSQDAQQRILVLANVGDSPVRLDLRHLTDMIPKRDLLTEQPISRNEYEVGAFDIAWLA